MRVPELEASEIVDKVFYGIIKKSEGLKRIKDILDEGIDYHKIYRRHFQKLEIMDCNYDKQDLIFEDDSDVEYYNRLKKEESEK